MLRQCPSHGAEGVGDKYACSTRGHSKKEMKKRSNPPLDIQALLSSLCPPLARSHKFHNAYLCLASFFLSCVLSWSDQRMLRLWGSSCSGAWSKALLYLQTGESLTQSRPRFKISAIQRWRLLFGFPPMAPWLDSNVNNSPTLCMKCFLVDDFTLTGITTMSTFSLA